MIKTLLSTFSQPCMHSLQYCLSHKYKFLTDLFCSVYECRRACIFWHECTYITCISVMLLDIIFIRLFEAQLSMRYACMFTTNLEIHKIFDSRISKRLCQKCNTRTNGMSFRCAKCSKWYCLNCRIDLGKCPECGSKLE